MIPTRPCPYCGRAQPESAWHCTHCGHEFQTRSSAPAEPPPAPAWDRRAAMQGRPALRVLLAFSAALLASVPIAFLSDFGPGGWLLLDAIVLAAVGACAYADPAGLAAALRTSGGAWLLLALPLALASSTLGWLYLRLLETLGVAANGAQFFEDWPAWALTLSIAVLPAINEEIAFRGIFLRTARIVLRPGWAQVATAAAFAAIHLQPAMLPFHFGLGLALGWLRVASGSLWPPMLLHAANNALAVGLLPAWPAS